MHSSTKSNKLFAFHLLGEGDRDGERAGLLIGERLRLRPTGDLLGGLRARLGELKHKIHDYKDELIIILIKPLRLCIKSGTLYKQPLHENSLKFQHDALYTVYKNVMHVKGC